MLGLMPSILWYAATMVVLVSLAGLLRARWRRRALRLLAASIGVIVVIALMPARLTIIEAPASRLDSIAPRYHYAERHERYVNAPPARVYAAMKATTASEIKLFQTFTWIRRFGRRGPESILNAPEQQPILDVATRTGFVLLADDPPRELVVGTMVAPFVEAEMNFLIAAEGSGSRISTETRVTGRDAAAIRRFTPYWRTILPGSWILRVTWLDAIARRAETN